MLKHSATTSEATKIGLGVLSLNLASMGVRVGGTLSKSRWEWETTTQSCPSVQLQRPYINGPGAGPGSSPFAPTKRTI